MDQVLHIFKKDIRRHWPEILISLALLALYTHRELHPWRNSLDYVFSRSFYFFVVTGQYVAPALIIFWVFLVVRVVQSESLVGDRQWWVTKPYVWWELLLAKLLFIFVFICVPLFHVQIFLLHHFHFPVFANCPALFRTLSSLFLLLVCFCLLLAGLTKNLAQLLMVVGVMALVLIASALWASQSSLGSAMQAAPVVVDYLTDFLIWIGLASAVVYQFARRRKWTVVGSLVVLIGFVIGISAVFTSSKVVERRYTPIDRSAAPLQISVKPVETSNESKDFSRSSSREVQLSIPVGVSGVAEGTIVQLNAVNIYAESPERSSWSPGWLYESQTFWPEDKVKTMSYSVGRREYEKLKDTPLHLLVDLAISEYQTVGSRSLQILSRSLSDQALGICRISSLNDSQIHCLYPTHVPEYVVRFDPQQSGCLDDDNEQRGQADTVSYAFKSHDEAGFPDPKLNPISDYDLSFNSVSLPSTEKETSKFRSVRFCPGTV